MLFKMQTQQLRSELREMKEKSAQSLGQNILDFYFDLYLNLTFI